MAIPFPNIDPIAFSIGPFAVRWYALSYMVGILIGWRYAFHLAAKGQGPEGSEPQRPSVSDIDDFVTWAVLGVVLGGRLGYVLFYAPEIFLNNPQEVLMVWNGGMSFHGGMLGVLLAMIFFARSRKIPFLRLSDIICACAPIGLFFGRIANFINGELYGRFTDVSWGVIFPDGSGQPRHPSQLYEAALEGLALLIVLALMIRRPAIRNRPGLVSGVFLLGYGASRMFIENFREPDIQIGYIAGFITMGQILCLPMILIGIGAIIYARKTQPAAP